MARNKTEKITLSFENLPFVRNLVEDYAQEENRSASAIIEKAVYDALLPTNRQVRDHIVSCLYAENGGSNEVLASIWGSNGGVNWGVVHNNYLPLVKFAMEQSAQAQTGLDGNEELLPYAIRQVQSVQERLVQLSEESPEKKSYYAQESENCLEVLNALRNNPQSLKVDKVFKIIIDNWDVLNDWAITYRLLYSLVKLSKSWNDSPKARLELIRLLESASDEW